MLRYTIFVRVEKTKTKTKTKKQLQDMDQIVNECARAYGLILKDKQIESISAFVRGHDTFVSLSLQDMVNP